MISRNIKKIFNFCVPSLLSGTITVLVAIVSLIIGSYSYLQKSGALYEFILGRNTSPELIESSQSSIAHLNWIVFGNPTLNKVLFFLFWLLIGLAVYLLINSLRQSASEAKSELDQMKYIHANKSTLKHRLVRTAALRLAGTITIMLYSGLFLKTLWPYCRQLSQSGLDSLGQPIGWLKLLLATLLLIFCIHIFTTLIRIIAGKPRLFNS